MTLVRLRLSLAAKAKKLSHSHAIGEETLALLNLILCTRFQFQDIQQNNMDAKQRYQLILGSDSLKQKSKFPF
jgi:hypothetical protein